MAEAIIEPASGPSSTVATPEGAEDALAEVDSAIETSPVSEAADALAEADSPAALEVLTPAEASTVPVVAGTAAAEV